MCDLLRFSTKEKIEGYKIVAKKLKGKKYFSVAMGFQYPSDGHIPITQLQHRITTAYKNDILSEGYRGSMAGRTAIFIHLESATKECLFLRSRGHIKKRYKLVIVRSEVSRGVMVGFYGSESVVAGRHIHFIEEVT